MRNALAAIVVHAELIELGDLDQRQRQSLDAILKAGRQLLELIDEAL